MRNNRIWLIPIVIVLLDFTLKMLAFNFLEYNHPVEIFNNFYLYLIYNTTPFNSFLHNTGLTNNFYLIFGSVVYLCFGISLLILPKYIHKKIIRIGVYILVETLCSVLTYIVVFIFKFDITLPSYLVSIIKFIGPLFVAFVLFILCKNIFYKILWGVYLGSGFGNFVNLLYPPFSIIDYLYILNKSNIGIFNLADFLITISVILFILYSILIFLQFIMRLTKKKNIKN